MAVRRYDEKILNELLDKYENSLLYSGKNQRQQNITFSVKRSTLPEYFDEASMQFDVIHAQLTELEKRGYVQLCWKGKKAGHILEKCTLCTDKVTEVYEMLGRCSRRERETRILKICEEYTGRHEVTDRFCKWIRERIGEGESVQQYVKMEEPESLADMCSLILEIMKPREEVFWREFSVGFFRDSKIAEKTLDRAAAVIRRFWQGESLAGLETEPLLEEFGIYRSPSWVMLKGCGRFNVRTAGIDSQIIDVGMFPGGIGISSRDIPFLDLFSAEELRQVVTVENLTSFHRMQEAGALVVYLGGYHNRIKRAFLQRLYESCPGDVIFEHFGDIDCGGFMIWKDLCIKTGIPFQCRGMDQETYMRYMDFGKELTINDRKMLGIMINDPFFDRQKDLFACILANGVKIEQECVRL